ncbi:MAG: lipopolysaccharide heptosyltransferase II [Pseudolabrys sp.]
MDAFTGSGTNIARTESAVAVFGFSGLGDLVRCHSLIRLIADRYPSRPIDLIVRRPMADIAAFMPEVRGAIGEDFRHSRLSPLARLKLVSELRSRDYGIAYIIPSSFKAALVPFLARIPERVGWSQEFRRPLLTRPKFRMRRLARMVDRICWLGIEEGQDPPQFWPEPRLAVPNSLRTQFDIVAASAQANAPAIAIAPGSTDTNKNWAVENFAAIARHCVDAGCTVWIVGATEHRELAAAIGQSAPVRDLLTDSLTQLALHLAAADIFVGNDSGPLHVAAAFNKPSIGVFGLTDAAFNAPINDVVKVAIPEFAIVRRSGRDVHWPTLEPVIRRLDRVIEQKRRVRRLSPNQ